MSLLLENLAKYVAKTFVLIAMLAIMAVVVDAQKRSGGKGKPNPSKKSQKYKKPTGESTPRSKKVTIARQSSALKVEPMPAPSHHFLHLSEEDWKDAVTMMSVFIVARFDDGVIRYRVGVKAESNGENLLTMNWDRNTTFVGFQKTKEAFDPNGCFMVIYCKTHTMALYLQRIRCL